VEAEFIYPVYLGESIAPYRSFEPVLAVIPWSTRDGRLLTADQARARGFSRLSDWLYKVEELWNRYGKKTTTFTEKMDFYRLLSSQFPIRGPRIVYSKSGKNPAAALITDKSAIIDHKLYWAALESVAEAHYLCAVLNSETARARAAKWQSQGQWGARDFDKVIFNLSIPKFSEKDGVHTKLAEAAIEAQKVAATVVLKSGLHFTRARAAIRGALSGVGISGQIDELVGQLLS
jgi:hypothetical protein